MSINILVTEDDSAIREMLKFALERERYHVFLAHDAAHARDILNQNNIDLLIVDWMMPQESGIDFIRSLRKDPIYADKPIIMLTAKVQEEDKVRGLDEGADDYLTKPVAIKELLARIRRLLRRTSPIEEEKIKGAGIVVNLTNYQVLIDDTIVPIGKTEFKLLRFFLEKPNRVYSRSQLLDFVWGRAVYLEERTVDVHMLRLRKILKPFGKEKLISTVRGVGYMFVNDAEPTPNES